MNLTCPPIRTLLVAGALIIAFLGMVTVEARAECGGYVTIGNKAKLRELQAKGYLPSEMKSHSKSKSEEESPGAYAKNENSSQAVSRDRALPSLPCDGPSCKSGKRPAPTPSEFVLTTNGVKSAFGKCSKGIVKNFRSGFIGFLSFDESPVKTVNNLDRPPE